VSAGIRVAIAAAETGVEPAGIASRAGGCEVLIGMPSGDLRRLGVSERFADAIRRNRPADVAAHRVRLADHGIRCFGVDEDGYPAELRDLSVPPVAIYLRGEHRLPSAVHRVSVVGSRHPIDAGLRLTRDMARFAAERGVEVVSGLALGIDAAAHGGALDGGGPTVAVLGCGVDVVYPRTNARLFDRVLANGVVVSEYAPGTTPAPWRFPARNRLIAALAGTLLVVEARGRSGALITADHALDLGRDVLAVPGSPTAAGAAGTNGLIKAGAGLIEDTADLAGWLGVDPPGERPLDLPAPLAAVLDAIAEGPAHPDVVVEGMPVADVSSAVLRLELEGLVTRTRGGELIAARRAVHGRLVESAGA
jgi:DNA processing protein